MKFLVISGDSSRLEDYGNNSATKSSFVSFVLGRLEVVSSTQFSTMSPVGKDEIGLFYRPEGSDEISFDIRR